MVSNSLNMDQREVIETLKRLRREFGKIKEYQEWRRELPDDWPI